MTIKAHFDGKAFIPDHPVNVPLNHPATVLVQQPQEAYVPPTDVEFERFLAEMDSDALTADHFVDWSRESIYSGTLDDPR